MVYITIITPLRGCAVYYWAVSLGDEENIAAGLDGSLRPQRDGDQSEGLVFAALFLPPRTNLVWGAHLPVRNSINAADITQSM